MPLPFRRERASSGCIRRLQGERLWLWLVRLCGPAGRFARAHYTLRGTAIGIPGLLAGSRTARKVFFCLTGPYLTGRATIGRLELSPPWRGAVRLRAPYERPPHA